MRLVGIVFLGGGLGSCVRALLLAWLGPDGAGPVLAINLAGAFLLGIVYVLADEAGFLEIDTRFFLAVGMLGGFTTFSTFGWGVDTMLARHDTGTASLYLAASIGGGTAAVAAGLFTGRRLAPAVEHAAPPLIGRHRQRANNARAAMSAIETEDSEDVE